LFFHLDVVVFCQDQHVGPSDRFVDDSSLMCKPAAIVSMISVKHIVIYECINQTNSQTKASQ